MTLPDIPDYDILETIGQGGMGAVYRARHLPMNRIVALKVVRPDVAQSGDFAARFEREMTIIAQLDHPGIVRGYHAGRHGDLHYIAMEYVPGRSVDAILRDDGALPQDTAVAIVRQVTAALAHAERHGIVHRDIKPANILVAEDGTTKLADFGLARSQIAPDGFATADGIILGTPQYIAPEQVMGSRHADTRSDIYSLGATLYHMVVGLPPFDGASTIAVMYKHVKEAVLPPRAVAPGVAEGLEKTILHMMRKRPEQRFQTCADLLAALDGLTGTIPAERAVAGAAASKRTERSFRAGMDCFSARDFPGAIENFKRFIVAQRVPVAHLSLGVEYVAGGRSFDRMMLQLNAALQRNPTDPSVRSRLAFLYVIKSQIWRKVERLRARPAGEEGDFQRRLQLARLFRTLREAEDCVQVYRRLLDERPNDVSLYGELGEAFTGFGRLVEAAKTCRTALKLQPNSVDLLLLLARALIQQGERNEAVAELRKATACRPVSAEAYATLARLLAAMGRPKEALATLNRGMELGADKQRLAGLVRRLESYARRPPSTSS